MLHLALTVYLAGLPVVAVYCWWVAQDDTADTKRRVMDDAIDALLWPVVLIAFVALGVMVAVGVMCILWEERRPAHQ